MVAEEAAAIARDAPAPGKAESLFVAIRVRRDLESC